MHVTSLQEHFTLAVECLVRIVAVDTAVLSPLFCEKDLALPGRFAAQAKVHKILVEASSAARAAAESYGHGCVIAKLRERLAEEEPVPAQSGQALPHRDAVLGRRFVEDSQRAVRSCLLRSKRLGYFMGCVPHAHILLYAITSSINEEAGQNEVQKEWICCNEDGTAKNR